MNGRAMTPSAAAMTNARRSMWVSLLQAARLLRDDFPAQHHVMSSWIVLWQLHRVVAEEVAELHLDLGVAVEVADADDVLAAALLGAAACCVAVHDAKFLEVDVDRMAPVPAVAVDVPTSRSRSA